MISSSGFVEQRATDREHLLLPARELRAAVPLPLGKPREELVDALWSPPPRAVVTSLDHAQVLVYGQRGEQPSALRNVANPEPGDLVRRLAHELRAPDANRAGHARGGVIPMIAAQSVVFPMPLRPRIETGCSPIVNDTSWSTCAGP